MTSQTRIIPQDEADQGFGLLKDIIEMVKNPKAIDEAYKRRSEAAKLTDDEVAESTEARALILRAGALRDELKKREDELEAAKAEFSNLVTVSDKKASTRESALNDRGAALDLISGQQENAEKSLAESRAKLESEIAQAKAALDKRESDLAAREKQLTDATATNAANSARISDWEAKLKAKAARLAAEAAS